MLAFLSILLIVVALIVDWKASGLRFFDNFVVRGSMIYVRLWHRWSYNRPAPFPLDRGALIVSNHTCSTDPMYILAGCRFPVGFLVAEEHFAINFFFRFILVNIGSEPVRRLGCDPVAVRRVLRKLAAGRSICIFPEGGLSGVALGRMRRGRPGVGYIALKSGAPVYPVYVDGGPRTDLLLNAWVYSTPKRARVIFGPPVDLSEYLGRPITRELVEKVTQVLMDSIKALAPTKRRESS